MKYRMLRVGEMILRGDEFYIRVAAYRDEDNPWNPTRFNNEILTPAYNAVYKYRRFLKSKPRKRGKACVPHTGMLYVN